MDGLSAALAKATRPATIHVYEGTGHWFAEPSVESAYDAGASELAWSRSLEFLLWA
ncbi:dienelactone hydrolase family protein [Kamptonema cortianum]|nr:dienelactone hydrolase family protein [Geitlerinema splendidum]MDK3158650.1 dienelactone hydrolase family protein [Kamptonema cortianum]